MKQWLAGDVPDEVFIEAYADEYTKLLPLWGPWYKGLGPVLGPFGIGPRDVTYVNFAKCWQTSGTRVYDAMDACAKAFPIRELYQIVRPDAVLVLSGESVFRAFPSLMQGTPRDQWEHFPGRRSFSFTQADISSMIDWLSTKLGVRPSRDK
jgi:hypothetical protein